MEITKEYMLIDLHMIDAVIPLVHMDKYRAWEQEIQDNLDCESLHFNIDEDDLLDDLESVYMVDTCSSSHREKSPSITYRVCST